MESGSPKTLRHSQTQTLIRIPESPSTSPDRARLADQIFDTFHDKLRFVPKGFQNHSAFKNGSKSPSQTKNPPSMPSPPKIASVTSIILTRAVSLSGSPVSNTSRILNRKSTFDVPMLPRNNSQQFPMAPLKEHPSSCVTSRRASPRASRPVTPLRSGSLASTKAVSGSMKIPLSRKNTRELLMLASSKSISSPRTNRDKSYSRSKTSIAITDRSHIKLPDEATRLMEIENEAKCMADRIAKVGSKDFERAINLYNRFHSKQLFEPEFHCETQRNFKLRVKSMVSSELQKNPPPQLNRGISFMKKMGSSTANVLPEPGVLKRQMTNFELILRRANTVKPEKIEEIEKKNKDAAEKKDLEQWSSFKLDDAANLKRMEEIRDALAPERELTVEEKNFLKLVKEGKDTMKLKYLINSNRKLVNLKDNRRETPLHWAVKKGHDDVVELLCKEGADVNAKDIASRKSVDIARRQENWRMVKYLEEGLFF